MAISKNVRAKVYERDGNKCLRCGSEDDLTIDHVMPLCRKGKNTFENMQTLCYNCNQLKGTNTTDYRWISKNGDDNYIFNKPRVAQTHKDKIINPHGLSRHTQKVMNIVIENKPTKNKRYEGRVEPTIIYNDIECPLFGYVNTTIGVGCEAGQPVYIYDDSKKLILNYVGTIIVYSYASFIKFVDFAKISYPKILEPRITLDNQCFFQEDQVICENALLFWGYKYGEGLNRFVHPETNIEIQIRTTATGKNLFHQKLSKGTKIVKRVDEIVMC